MGNQVALPTLHAVSQNKQGDTLSPTLFSLVAVVLVYTLKACLPEARRHLYADDTLVFLPGTFSNILLLDEYSEM